MDIQREQQLRERAKARVKAIRGFYSHLTVYIIVNLLIIVLFSSITSWTRTDWTSWWTYLSTPVFWGIGLLAHGIYVFAPKITFIKDWEERKIKELMEKDRQHHPSDHTF
ncbi:2TM domain-containing protein [Croceiramulus getboli]|nr:2TM domain-containing protein [Flavobacteriaceae bacterium YJPT1-3]